MARTVKNRFRATVGVAMRKFSVIFARRLFPKLRFGMECVSNFKPWKTQFMRGFLGVGVWKARKPGKIRLPSIENAYKT